MRTTVNGFYLCVAYEINENEMKFACRGLNFPLNGTVFTNPCINGDPDHDFPRKPSFLPEFASPSASSVGTA